MPRGQYDRSPEAAAARATSKGGEKPAKTSKTSKTPKAAKAPKAVKVPKAAKQTRAKREFGAIGSVGSNFTPLDIELQKLHSLRETFATLSISTGGASASKSILAKIEAIAERLEPAPKAEASGETEDTVKTSKKAPAAFTAPSQNGQAAFVPLARSAT